MIRTSELSRERSLALIQNCFAEFREEADRPFRTLSDDPDAELTDQRELAGEYLRAASLQLAGRRFSPELRRRAASMLQAKGIELGDDDRATELIEGLARALVEQQKLFLFRLGESLLPYQSDEPLFALPLLSQEVSEPPRRASRAGPTVGEALDGYLKARKRDWTAKTLRTNAAKLDLLRNHLGPDTALSAVGPEHIREYRDGLSRLRAKHHTGAGKSFVSRQTTSEEGRISHKTAGLHFEACKAFFRWARDDAYLQTNPAVDIRLSTPKKLKGSKARRPFTADELANLFSAPVFNGCRSSHRRFQPGPEIIRDGYFWIPLIGFYSGMRLAEIVQLQFRDINVDADVPFFDVNDLPGGDPKHVKSQAGMRSVPIHPDLLQLGFAAWLRDRTKGMPSTRRVFPEVRYGADGQPSSIFSKWFARLLNSQGLEDERLVFHSFRHGMADAFREALTPQYITDKIMGHANPATSASYGAGASLQSLADALKAAKLPLSVPALLLDGEQD